METTERITHVALGPERRARLQRLRERKGIEHESIVLRQALDAGLDALEMAQDELDRLRQEHVANVARGLVVGA